MVWDKRSLELLDKEVGSFLVSCRFRNIDNGFVWASSSVYGPFSRDGGSLLWKNQVPSKVYGRILSVLGETSMLSASPRSEAVKED